MPGLFATLGLKATQYSSGLQAAVQSAKQFFTQSSAGATAAGVAQTAANTQVAASSYLAAKAALQQAQAQHAQSVAAVKAARANLTYNGVVNRAVALQLAGAQATALSTAATVAQARANLTAAAPQGVMNMLFGQFLVIGREIARGQWARAVSSATRLMQMFGLSLVALIPILAALGLGLYFVISTFEGLRKGAERLANTMGHLTSHIENHIKVMREGARMAREYHEWLEKLNEVGKDRSMTKAADDEVAAMRKKFDMMQKLSKATPAQKAEAEKEELDKEAKVLEKAAAAAKVKSDASKKAVEDAEDKSQKEIKRRQIALDDAKDDAAAAIKVRKETAKAVQETGLVPQALGGAGFHPWIAIANAMRGIAGKSNLAKLPGGEIVNVNDVRYQSAVKISAEDKAAAALDEAEEAEKRRRKAADVDAADTAALEEKARAAREKANAAEEVETNVGKKGKDRAILTQLQQIGAFTGPAFGSDALNVQKGIARDVKGIHQHLTHSGTGSSHGGSMSVGGF